MSRKTNPKWKPIKITVEEHTAIGDALHRKALELARALNYPRGRGTGMGVQTALFYSDNLYPCSYSDVRKPRRPVPKSFHSHEPSNLILHHFLPIPCDCKEARMGSDIEVICLANVWDPVNGPAAGDDYYLHTHRIGRCPFKSAYPGITFWDEEDS